MLRPTREQIDACIVDAAAAMFAEHGYDRTSLREIAGAVGYSKTGLLHRFRSKELLRDAVAEQCVDAVRGVLASVEDLPAGAERDTAVVHALADLAVSAPGRLSLALARAGALSSTPAGEVLAGVPELLGRCFALPGPDRPGGGAAGSDLERSLRVTAALAVIGTLAVAFPQQPPQQLRQHVTGIALEVLGLAPAPPPAPPTVLPPR